MIDEEQMSPSETSQRRVVWFDNGWTIIEDLSLILCTDEESLTKVSRHLSAPVFSLATQGTSGCSAFWYFDNQKLRGFSSNDGEVTDNFGTPLSQEANFNINENASYDDIHGVAIAFGIDWANAANVNRFTVKHLENSDELNRKFEQAVNDFGLAKTNDQSKPWWKFW